MFKFSGFTFLVIISFLVVLTAFVTGTIFDDPDFLEESLPRPDGGSWDGVVGISFPEEGSRIYTYERGGRVWILDEQDPVTSPMIDINDEVLEWRDFGMVGFALGPNFNTNGHLYLFYGVDRHHLEHCVEPPTGIGAPICDAGYDPNSTIKVTRAVIGRVTRYTAIKPIGDPDFSKAVTVDYDSRKVLVGETIQTGPVILHQSHGTGTLIFGTDGTLIASMGDGASFSSVDVGSASETAYAEALADGIITAKENVGAYRAQLLDSLSGKILRIDPETGDGLPSNPFFDPANPRSAQSRTWALGLRNPFRITLRPGTGSHDPMEGNPGTLYIGDVGMDTWEELNVCTIPGQNFGWPAFEGMEMHTSYWNNAPENQDATNYLGCPVMFTDLIQQEALSPPSFPNPCGPGDIITFPTFRHSRPTIDWNHNVDTPRYPAFAPSNEPVPVIIDSPIPGTTQILVQMDPPGSPLFRGNASAGGVWYTGADFPPQYQNTYFHGDYGGRWIKNFVLDENEQPLFVRPFLSDAGSIVAIATHPIEGQLYYIRWGDKVQKVIYAPGGNRPPTAIGTAVDTFGSNPLTVSFTGDQSMDPESSTLSYEWDFGDGSPLRTEPNPQHIYSAPDGNPLTYFATLTVQDSGSPPLEDWTQILISVNNTPPNVTITSPTDGSNYPTTGDTVYDLSANISDAEHNFSELTCAWETELVHNNHSHFDPKDFNCTTTQTLISALGCGLETYFYNIHLTVTDPEGLETKQISTIYPDCAANTPPVAIPDSATVNEVGSSVEINVLQNDTDDVAIDPTTVLIGSGPTFGTTSVQPNTGVITYTSDGITVGNDVFSYTVKDLEGAGSNSASVSVSILGNVSSPIFSPGSGSYVHSVSVSLATPTTGATIYYTADGSDPTTSSSLFTPESPILMTVDTTLKARAYKTGLNPGNIASAHYTFLGEPLDGLIAHWPLDEGSGSVAQDVTGLGNQGTINGASWADGISGGALSFDGSTDNVRVPHTADLAFSDSDSYTLSVWVQVNALPGSWSGIVTKSRDDAPWYGLWISPSNRWINGGTNITGPVASLGWHHLAAVQDVGAGESRFYVDGILSAVGFLEDSDGSGDLLMGGAGGVNEFFEGVIDEVRVYDRGLSNLEILFLASEFGNNAAPLVNAGPDLTVTVGDTLHIDDSNVIDDGLPNPPGMTSVLWSEEGSSAGSWPLGDETDTHTHVEFSSIGTFLLRLTADDNELTAFDELVVTVTGDVVMPIFTPGGGTYTGLLLVSLSTSTSGATVYYTLDGSDPTPGSLEYIPGFPIIIDVNTTVKGRGYKTGLSPSPVATAVYVFDEESIPGLIGYWPFEEGSGAVTSDASGGGHQGTIHGASWTSGMSGKALNFYGSSDTVQISHTANLAFSDSDSYTLSVWVQVNTLPGSWRGIVTKSRDDAPWYGLWISPSNHWTHGGSSITGPLASLGWHHLAAVQDVGAGESRLYVDGILSGVGFPRDSDGSGDLLIGGAGGVNEFFEGVIDEVRIYDRGLSNQEILFLASEFGNNSAPLVNAGPDLTVTVGDILHIDDSNVIDDGLPNPPGMTSVLWSEEGSSAGSWPLGDKTSTHTHVEFSSIGTFLLRLTADDNELTAFDELVVTVTGNVAMPIFTPAGGTFTDPLLVSLSTATNGATVYYTLDGSDPTSGSLEYTPGFPIILDVNTTVKARGYKTGLSPSPVATAVYVFDEESIPGLIGYWPFEEGSGAVTSDASGGGHQGTIHGASWTSVMSGKALIFNGSSDTVQISHTANLAFSDSDSYTLSVWVQVNTLPGSWRGIVTKSRDDAPWYGLWISPSNHWTHGGSSITGPLASLGWHHLAAVQDVGAGESRLYVDGILSGVGFPRDSDGSGDLLIGGAGGVNEFFEGVIDEVRIYDRGLSNQEILFLASEFGNNSAPLVNAGPDLTVTVGDILHIDDSNVIDDGLPNPPGMTSVLWSEEGSSAGSWPLGDETDTHTHVEFSSIGTFLLRLTADDNELTAFDELVVTVTGNVAMPIFTPAGGTFTDPLLVSLSTATNGATVYYTLDGSDPTSGSLEYTPGFPIILDVNTTVKARGYKTGLSPSPVATAVYVFDEESIPGLIGYWPFEEGSGAVTSDASGGGHQGTIHGASWTSGMSGEALSFDGIDDSVQIAHTVDHFFHRFGQLYPDDMGTSGHFTQFLEWTGKQGTG